MARWFDSLQTKQEEQHIHTEAVNSEPLIRKKFSQCPSLSLWLTFPNHRIWLNWLWDHRRHKEPINTKPADEPCDIKP